MVVLLRLGWGLVVDKTTPSFAFDWVRAKQIYNRRMGGLPGDENRQTVSYVVNKHS